jgi:hypothetical protein
MYGKEEEWRKKRDEDGQRLLLNVGNGELYMSRG